MSKFTVIFILLAAFTARAEMKLALNWKPEPQFGGFYEAERAGLFKKEKLDVKILQGGSGTPTVQMLANNQCDFAIVSAEEILVYNNKNPQAKVVAVFATFQTNPQIIMAHAEKNYSHMKDVFKNEGTLSIQSGLSYAQYLLKRFAPVKAKVVPYLGGITNFLNDKNFSQQGFLTSEPIAAEKSGAKVKTFLVADEGFNPYTTVVAVRAADVKKPSTKAAVAAIKNGWINYLAHPEETNKLMGQLNKSMDAETFAKSAAAQVSLIQPTKDTQVGSMTDERWRNLAAAMIELNLINKATDVKENFENF